MTNELERESQEMEVLDIDLEITKQRSPQKSKVVITQDPIRDLIGQTR